MAAGVQALVQAGADIHKTTKFGQFTAIDRATSEQSKPEGSVECVRLLIAAGAHAHAEQLRQLEIQVEIFSKYEMTPGSEKAKQLQRVLSIIEIVKEAMNNQGQGALRSD